MGDNEHIGRSLADAHRELEERSGIGSSSSEPRDSLDEGRRVQEELERRSNTSSASSRRKIRRADVEGQMEGTASGAADDARSEAESVSSLGTTNSVRAVYKAGAGAVAPGAPGAAASGGVAQGNKKLGLETAVITDKVELLILDAKRQALDKVKDSSNGACGSGSHSNVGSNSSIPNTNRAKAKETACSVSGSGSHSNVGSGSSSLTTSRTPSVPLPPTVAQALPSDKKVVMDKVMSTVIDKTGQELAQMQLALDKARESTLAEAREKAELEAKLAKASTTNIGENAKQQDLKVEREKKVEVESERDDLKDKLVGMQTLLDAKMERHMQEKEELRQKNALLEEELKKKADTDKDKLKTELAMAAQEMEKAKKAKYAVASERDVLKRAELIAKKAHEAELQSIKAEMATAKVELKKAGIRPAEVLDIVADDNIDPHELVDPETADSETLLALKLREQRENNKKLHQEFEKLRLDMLNLHQEKETELAELKAKVEVQSSLPGKALLTTRGRPQKGQKKGGQQGGKLSSIDEEEDEDMASQAGSGVSGQVSSDCDGCGVGDLRDFDDYEENKTKVKNLQGKLADSEAWYEHLKEMKKAKEAEYQAKVNRLAEQLQQVREEAIENKDWARQLEVDKQEIEAEKQAEVESVKAKLISQQLQNFIPGGDSSSKVIELEEKLGKYTTEVLDLKDLLGQSEDKLNAALEEKRLLFMRLSDTRRELEAMEERHNRAIAQMQARLRAFGEEAEDVPLPAADDNDMQAKVWSLEEDLNIARNELEGQQVHWQAQLESEQHQSAAALAKLAEEQELAEKDRDLRRKVEEKLQETERMLKATRQSLAESEQKLELEKENSAKQVVVHGSFLDLLRCPTRSRDQAPQNLPMQVSGSGSAASCQGIVWQVLSSIGGIAALLCSDESLTIRDASKKAFTMWGSATLRGSSLFKLIYEEGMAAWLKSEMDAPATPAFAVPNGMSGFWLRDLGFVEFRSRLGSAFDASVVCARLPEEIQQGRPAVIVVVVQPTDEDQRPAQNAPSAYPSRAPQQQMFAGSRPHYRNRPESVASSVHSEDITANDSVSNVNARW